MKLRNWCFCLLFALSDSSGSFAAQGEAIREISANIITQEADGTLLTTPGKLVYRRSHVPVCAKLLAHALGSAAPALLWVPLAIHASEWLLDGKFEYETPSGTRVFDLGPQFPNDFFSYVKTPVRVLHRPRQTALSGELQFLDIYLRGALSDEPHYAYMSFPQHKVVGWFRVDERTELLPMVLPKPRLHFRVKLLLPEP